MRNIIQIFLSDARRLGTNVVAIVVIMGLTVIPCLYAWFNIFSNWDPYGQEATSKLQVAVASSDEGADLGTTNLNIGGIVIKNLKQNKSIDWQFPKTADEARDGVRSGKYYAALIIDKGFSKDMISFLGGDPKHPEISYYENEKKNAIAPKITSKVKTTVQQQVNRSFVSTLASSLVQVSNYVVTTDNQKNLSGSALLRMKQMDSDLSLLIGMIDSYVALIDTTNSLANASAAITDELNNIMDQSRLMEDSASNSFDQAQNTAKSASDLVSNSLNSLSNQATTMKATVDSLMKQLEETGKITDSSVMSLHTAAETMKTSVNSLTNYGYTEDQLKQVNADFDQLITDLDSMQTNADKTKEDAKKIQTQMDTDFKAIQSELETLKSDYQNTVVPKMNATMASIKKSLNEAQNLLSVSGGSISKLSGALSSYPDMLSLGRDSLISSKAEVQNMKTKLEDLISDMESLTSNDQYTLLMKLIQTDPDLISDFVSNPVTMNTQAEYPVENNGSGTAPFYIILSIWVGAVILIAIMHTQIKHPEEFPDLKNYQAYFGRYIVYFLIGQMQTLITVLGALFYVKIQCHHPILFYLACAVTSLAFTMLMYSLTFAFGTVGEAVCVVLMVIQVAGSGGTFPIDVLPDLYKNIYALMPFQYAMNAVRECIGGMHGNDYWIYVLKLLPFIAFSLILGLVIAIPYSKLNRIIEEAKEKTGVLE